MERTENGCIEAFNGKLRDELLKSTEIFFLAEAREMLEQYRLDYNNYRTISPSGHQPWAEYARQAMFNEYLI